MRKYWRRPTSSAFFDREPLSDEQLEHEVALAIGQVIARGRVEPRGEWLKAAREAIKAVRRETQQIRRFRP